MRRHRFQQKRDAQARPGFQRYRVPDPDARLRRYVQADMGRRFLMDREQFGENKAGTTELNLYGQLDERTSVLPQYTGGTAPTEAVLYGAMILQPAANDVVYYRWRIPPDALRRGVVRLEVVLMAQTAIVDLASLTVEAYEVRHGSPLRAAANAEQIFDVPLLTLVQPTPFVFQYTLSGVADEIHFKVTTDNIVTTGGTLAIVGASVAYTSRNNHRHTP